MIEKPGRLSRQEDNKERQKLTLNTAPALKHYFVERDAIEANTAKLRALRLAREAEAATEAAAQPAKSEKKKAPAKRTRRPAIRRGIGSS